MFAGFLNLTQDYRPAHLVLVMGGICGAAGKAGARMKGIRDVRDPGAASRQSPPGNGMQCDAQGRLGRRAGACTVSGRRPRARWRGVYCGGVEWSVVECSVV
jgi:hypothetical protein